MGQNPWFSYRFGYGTKKGAVAPGIMDANGVPLVGGGGQWIQANAAAVISAVPTRMVRLIVQAPGTTSGAFTLNDCATTGAAASANEFWTLAYNATANVAGAVFYLDWPCSVGLVLSAVPGGGSPIVNISFV